MRRVVRRVARMAMSDTFMDDDCFVSLDKHTEMEAIKGMLRLASEHGLEAEVVREMVRQVNTGVDIEQACANALVEWDL